MLVLAEKRELVLYGTMWLNCSFIAVLLTRAGWGDVAWTSRKLLGNAAAGNLLQHCGDLERTSEELWSRGQLLNVS